MIIVSLSLGYFALGLDPILAFWPVYILTRPLGDSSGDLMSQPVQYGGFGLGTVVTSALFLATLMAIVIFMSPRHGGEEASASGGDELGRAAR